MSLQVDIRLTLALKTLGFQPVESTSPFKVVVSDGSTCTPYYMVTADDFGGVSVFNYPVVVEVTRGCEASNMITS